MNIVVLFLQFLSELIRTLLFEEVSDRVRRRFVGVLTRQRRKQLNVAARVHLRVRQRLLHKLATDDHAKL